MSHSPTHSELPPPAPRPADRSRMCDRKVRYRDKKDAQTYLNRYERNRGRHGRPEWLRAYPCPFCGGWHVTKGKPVK